MDSIRALLDRLLPDVEAILGTAHAYGAPEVLEALEHLLRDDVAMGEKVAAFERAFAEHVGAAHAVMVAGGSSANLLILAALANPRVSGELRLMPGDEVLVPAVASIATVSPVIHVGCEPVLVDAGLDTLTMSVEAAREAISPRTRAIFVAHLLGNAADLDGLRALAEERDLLLLEDACEALGATYRGKPLGTSGLAASFGLDACGHGGVVVTGDAAFAELLRALRAHGWTRDLSARKEIEAEHPDLDPRFLFWTNGFDLRPSELQAAFGHGQLRRASSSAARRREIASRMAQGLEPLRAHLAPARATEGAEPAWSSFPVLLSEADAARRGALIEHLAAQGIEARPIAAGNLASQPVIGLHPHRFAEPLANAAKIHARGLSWACSPSMTDAQVDGVVAGVRGFFGAG